MGELFVLLSKKFIWLIFIAFVISVPVTYHLMGEWLASFAFHINIGYGVFALAGILSLTISIITVSYKTVKTARLNPAEVLKYE